MRTKGLLALAVLAGGLLAMACSRQESGWREASERDDIAAYEAYLERYPAGAHADAARARVAEIREEREWSRARRLATPEAYQRYLAGYPEGRHAAEARERLSQFLQALPAAPAGGAVAAVAGEEPPAAGPPPAESGWSVQLGALSSESVAGELAERRLQEHADLLAGLGLRVEREPGRGLWRLRAGPMAEAEARELCAEFMRRGASCVPSPD